jgi:N6-adenosine-specific RNA methylase IME4
MARLQLPERRRMPYEEEPMMSDRDELTEIIERAMTLHSSDDDVLVEMARRAMYEVVARSEIANPPMTDLASAALAVFRRAHDPLMVRAREALQFYAENWSNENWWLYPDATGVERIVGPSLELKKDKGSRARAVLREMK